jgi:hypothetical protein
MQGGNVNHFQVGMHDHMPWRQTNDGGDKQTLNAEAPMPCKQVALSSAYHDTM